MEFTIFRELLKTNDTAYTVTLETVVDRLRDGKSKDAILKIRSLKQKKARNDLKKKLPCILFNGKFKQRNGKGLVKHSGLMITDYDNFQDEKTYKKVFKQLKENKHIILAFRSPSGAGLKAVVRIPETTAEQHPVYHKQFSKDFPNEYWDKSNSDVNRVCFESYDPDLYYNPSAVIYNPSLSPIGYDVKDRTPIIPIVEEQDIIDRIMKFDMSHAPQDGNWHDFILALAGWFCEYGVSKMSAHSFIENNYWTDDVDSRKHRHKTIESAYRLRKAKSKYFENWSKIDKIKNDGKLGRKEVLKKYDITDDVFEEIEKSTNSTQFWIIKEKKDGSVTVIIDPYKYKIFLESNGFKKYYPNETIKPVWVWVQSNKVRIISVEIIKDFVLEYLISQNEMIIWNHCARAVRLFTESHLLMLESIDLMMLRDKPLLSFVAFDNGILEVYKDKAVMIDYLDVDGYIWESQIINRSFELSSSIENDYKTFISNISGTSINAMESMIGYLLCTYKNKTNNKAIILNDEVISENPEGGTGKGLLVQGIRQIRRVAILDGKAFDDTKSFPYQTVNQDTQVLIFDDVKKAFNFESKFSLVTEGLTLERKNKDAIKLTVEESPKIVISTNYAIQGDGNSHTRRRHEIEVKQHYNGNITPFDEFGKQLFDDWDEVDFLAFDNYMIKCLQKYLNIGLIEQDAVNLKLRKFIASTSMDFHEWISDRDNFTLNERHEKAAKWESFVAEYPDYAKTLKRKSFHIWTKKYAQFIGAEFLDGNSNGSRWFEIRENDGLEAAPF